MKLSTRRVYTGKVLNLDVDTVKFPDGSTGELEMIRHSGASAVVPVLSAGSTADPVILLIRQFRHAADGPIWEVPAGRLDPGESPENCAGRELLEEAGYRAGKLERLTTVYTTPGFTDEQIHLFVASGLTQDRHRREADEFMEVASFPLSAVLTMIATGEIFDGKTVASILFFSRFRTTV